MDVGNRIAVVRALPGVGDMLCAVPALRALRRAAPHSEITLVGLRQSSWFPERFGPYVDHFLPCPVWPGLAEVDGPRGGATPFLEAARRCRFDVAFQMHGCGPASNELTAALGARRWFGLTADPDPPDDARGVLGRYPTDRHEVDRCSDVLALAGITVTDQHLEFPVTAEDERQAGELVAGGTSFAIVHPGASRTTTRWSPIGFGHVAAHLLSVVDLVLVTGTHAEREVTGAVRTAAGAPPGLIDLAGATEIGTLAALMRRAAVVVANDTGAAHLGAAVGASVVTVCGPSDQVRWAPRGAATRTVGGVPFGRWPTIRQVRTAIDLALAGITRSGS